jgi:hypothetical protein
MEEFRERYIFAAGDGFFAASDSLDLPRLGIDDGNSACPVRNVPTNGFAHRLRSSEMVGFANAVEYRQLLWRQGCGDRFSFRATRL